ncbi:MAG: polysaccharide biosynthesis/export family protein, partial [Flavobacteriaceae bacterium]
DPYVDVKLLNAHFTILGEVNKPGKYEYFKNNMNILEAIGMAGDLTINGMRKDIKLIRDYNGEIKVSSIDLTKKSFISDNFQIFSRDIIIINPNETKIKNAGVIGNSGTLLSLLSFLTTLIVLISN